MPFTARGRARLEDAHTADRWREWNRQWEAFQAQLRRERATRAWDWAIGRVLLQNRERRTRRTNAARARGEWLRRHRNI